MHDIISLAPGDLTALLPPRPAISNKSTFGRVVALCGSVGMCGAAYLAAKAAYRCGCGLVEIVTPEQNRIPLQTLLPEAIVTCYDSESPDTAAVAKAVRRADAVAIGCGLGTSAAAARLLDTALTAAKVPVVVDADALNIIAADPQHWLTPRVPVIITPHPGEMARLTGYDTAQVLRDVPGLAASFAKEKGIVCLLKHHKTAISDGSTTYINQFGNSGMATGGSGDVLTGIIAALLAQGKNYPAEGCNAAPDLCKTAALGALIHSLAGDRAAARLGEYALMASDIIDEIGNVMK